jgi:hypothetical protein
VLGGCLIDQRTFNFGYLKKLESLKNWLVLTTLKKIKEMFNFGYLKNIASKEL